MITALVLLCRVALAAVFAIAGVSKLASFTRTRESVIEFGVPSPLALPFTVLLIICELAVAVALIPELTAWYAAIAAVTLFSVFGLAIAWNLLRGRRPACNCFGQLQPSEIGWSTLARNIAFAAIGALIIADPYAAAQSLFTWTTAGAVALLLLFANGALLVAVLQQQGRMLLRFDGIERHLGVTTETPQQQHFGLEPGTQAPSFPELERLLAPKLPLLIVFTDPNCGPCHVLAPQLSQWQEELREQLTIATLSRDAEGGREAAEAYEAWGTPSAVLVSPAGRIASYVAQGSTAINGLVGAFRIGALQHAIEMPAVSPGDEPPDLILKTRDGDEIALAGLRGTPSLLVFWSDACGFCQRMLGELETWKNDAGPTAPRLFLLPLDENAEAASAFGARGTPMGILIDAQGRIASRLVAGAAAIFALAPVTNGRTNHGSLV
jgi:thiol-disulfide isomerase/thioredoxin/uncharacterized membrane protein YphA (DoxX/SURF4 family)